MDYELREEVAGIKARLEGMDRAVELSATTLDKRLHEANGLVEEMRQQAEEFARGSELTALANRVESLEQARSRNEGTAQGRQPASAVVMVLVAAVIAVAVSFVASRVLP